MEKIYIVLYNYNVSSEGYKTEEEAINFIEKRNKNPKRVTNGWLWIDKIGNEYKIKEILIR